MRLTVACLGLVFSAVWMSSVRCLAGDASPAAGTHGHYAVLTATPGQLPPFEAVDVLYGPREDVAGVSHLWWQLEVRAKDSADAAPLLQLRALTREDPLQAAAGNLSFSRYLLRIPETAEALENLWWVRVLDPQGTNEAARQYRRLMQNTLRAYHEALDRNEDFDFAIDVGTEPAGYRRIVRVGDSETLRRESAATPGR